MKRTISFAALLIITSFDSYSQQRVVPADSKEKINAGKTSNATKEPNQSNSTGDASAGSSTPSEDYVFGPGDLLTVAETELGDLYDSKTFRVDNGGDVSFPLAGRIHALGLNASALQTELNTRLARILREPDAVIGIAEFHSQPISVLGEVNFPGVHQLQGAKNLFEVLSLAGGLSANAGNTIKITRKIQRGPIPLPNAQSDPTGQFSIASVNTKNIMAGTDPAANIPILPDDIISVPKCGVVYAVGFVIMPGGFLLGENDSLSALQVVSLAQGLQKTAASDKAKILRLVSGNPSRMEIPVNVKKLIAGKSLDVPLQADDILFIPSSDAKSVGYRTVDAIVNAASGLALLAGKY
jgi:polysaccharide biosynthesis/export protein